MRQLQPVLWTKGLVLAPQHLQVQDRFFEDRLGFHVASLGRFPWGFRDLAIDEDALAAGVVRVDRAAGAFPDGTVFDLPLADGALPPRHVAEGWGADEATLLVSLAIPDYRPDGRNVSAGEDGLTRYRADVVQLRDETTGLAERPLQVARKNLRLLLDGETTEGYATLPLVRLSRMDGTIAIDRAFVPPLLDIAASRVIMDMLRRLVERLTTRSAVLSGMRRQRNVDLAHFSSGDVAGFWLLYTINLHLPVFRHLRESGHAHPLDLYEEMLALAGTLTTFSSSVDPGHLPLYDHADVGGSFARLDTMLHRLLETAVPENVVTLPLREVEPSILAVALDEDRFLAAPRAWLAVRSSLPRPDLVRLVPTLVKVSSTDRVSRLVRQALAGAVLVHAPEPPGAVPVKLDHEYFELQRNGLEWDAIVGARNLAAYVPAELSEPQVELVLMLPPRSAS